jgi:predicted neuraminidase
LFFDDKQRLWLLWSTILNNQWESALSRYKISVNYEQQRKSPVWQSEHILHFKPGEEFAQAFDAEMEKVWQPYFDLATPEQQAKLREAKERKTQQAHDKLWQRLGWMFRVHPTLLPNGRIILPLYSDTFDFSLMAYSDNRGETWQVTRPLIGAGNVQPSIARRKDGSLVAYFRDNGPPPQRVMQAESKDNGVTWSAVFDTDRVDSGTGVEVCVLQSGRWLLVHNDTETKRRRLAVSLSEDEGKTWRTARYLENDPDSPDVGSYSYPSIIQAKNGRIHVTYTYRPSTDDARRLGSGSSIKHAEFNEAWILGGTP